MAHSGHRWQPKPTILTFIRPASAVVSADTLPDAWGGTVVRTVQAGRRTMVDVQNAPKESVQNFPEAILGTTSPTHAYKMRRNVLADVSSQPIDTVIDLTEALLSLPPVRMIKNRLQQLPDTAAPVDGPSELNEASWGQASIRPTSSKMRRPPDPTPVLDGAAATDEAFGSPTPSLFRQTPRVGDRSSAPADVPIRTDEVFLQIAQIPRQRPRLIGSSTTPVDSVIFTAEESWGLSLNPLMRPRAVKPMDTPLIDGTVIVDVPNFSLATPTRRRGDRVPGDTAPSDPNAQDLTEAVLGTSGPQQRARKNVQPDRPSQSLDSVINLTGEAAGSTPPPLTRKAWPAARFDSPAQPLETFIDLLEAILGSSAPPHSFKAKKNVRFDAPSSPLDSFKDETEADLGSTSPLFKRIGSPRFDAQVQLDDTFRDLTEEIMGSSAKPASKRPFLVDKPTQPLDTFADFTESVLGHTPVPHTLKARKNVRLDYPAMPEDTFADLFEEGWDTPAARPTPVRKAPTNVGARGETSEDIFNEAWGSQGGTSPRRRAGMLDLSALQLAVDQVMLEMTGSLGLPPSRRPVRHAPAFAVEILRAVADINLSVSEPPASFFRARRENAGRVGLSMTFFDIYGRIVAIRSLLLDDLKLRSSIALSDDSVRTVGVGDQEASTALQL